MIWGLMLLAALLGYAIWLFNHLVHDRNTALAAWSDIDVQLKRRHDLIPKLVDAVKAYAGYEQATLSQVTELRAAAAAAVNAPGACARAEGAERSRTCLNPRSRCLRARGRRSGPGAATSVRAAGGLPGPQGQHPVPGFAE